ncbi:NACHT, LRR and PYD domains-containing protein 3-like isoform X2 [Halichondria panicea]|uniref:NACHT, LRR and PYD domains-containing protein 3-like isoform X2 n=1 Tax=Halichondria panicea TaxID=6063 RepID=UPI00312B8742
MEAHVLSEFVEGLKEAYRERLFNMEEQWPPVRGDKLIKLHLVEAEKEEGFRAGLPQPGAPNEKVKRTPILHENLFKIKEGKKPEKKLIVEGNAGIGKTTLCTMLAEGWAEGNILTQFDCVLLLPLREQLVSSASSLTDLLALHHPDEIICEPVVRHLKRIRGKGVLIIADGWDELSEANRSKASFLYNLLFGRHLPFISVLLTSRPSASAPLHDLPSVDRLVEVVGFNEENIKQYIESEFDQFPEKASSLIEQLENNPVLESVCSVPLNCAIVCNLWHTLDRELPRTLTELYTQIVLNIILRNIKKKFPDCPIGLNSFDEIPNDLQDTFWLICEFAYECLLLDQLVFSEAELSSRLPDVGDKLQCFGLLQSARSLLPVGHGLSFHFAHLTIQEFMAALHLATLPNEEKLKVVKASARSVRFNMVWRFMFGLASKLYRESDKVISFNDSLVDQFLMAKNQDVLALCHVAFEASDPDIALRVCKMSVRHLFHRGLSTPFDCVAGFHVLRYAEKCDNMVIRISYCAIDDMLLKKLTDILSDANGHLQVRDLSLVKTKVSDKGVADLFKRASVAFTALDTLLLYKNNFTGIMSIFIHKTSTSLTQLDLSTNPLGVSGIQSLETAVRSGALIKLESLGLSNTLTDDADINGALLTTLLQSISSHCARLLGLDLSVNNLGLPGLCSVVENVPLGLNSIGFSGCFLTSADIVMLIHFLKSANVICKKLKLLNLSSNCIDDDGVIALAECLPERFPSLVGFNVSPLGAVLLYGNPVSEELIHMCNDNLKVIEETAVLNKFIPQEYEEVHTTDVWDVLLSEMICTICDDDRLASHVTIFFPDPFFHNPNSSSDEPTYSTTELQGTYTHTDSDVSVADSSSDEVATPTLPTSSPYYQASSVPPELTLSVLDKELKTLTKPIKFGVSLGIPQHILEVIQQDNRFNTEGQKIALFQFIAKNYKSLRITWSIIADALHDIDYGDLSSIVRRKYCTI